MALFGSDDRRRTDPLPPPIPFPMSEPAGMPQEPGFGRPPREREPEGDRQRTLIEKLAASVNDLVHAVEDRTDLTEKRTDAVMSVVKQIAEVTVYGQSPLEHRLDAIADMVLRLVYEEMNQMGDEVWSVMAEDGRPPAPVIAAGVWKWAKARRAAREKGEQQ